MKENINPNNIPEHIAIIMDGNGRWAKKQGAVNRIFGHKNALKAVRKAVKASAEIGVKYLTLYAFSSENWNRPEAEVKGLMQLLVNTLGSETENLHRDNVRLNAIGDLSLLPGNCQRILERSIEITKNNTGLTLTLALSYSGRREITEACQKIGQLIKDGKIEVEQINEELMASQLFTKDIPDPELLIRTSGELRLSNFLLWQVAYTEIYVTETLWPDFNEEELFRAVHDYQKRERRFGKTSEQVQH